MVSMQQNTIYQGNSIISVETLPEYSQPVVIKKPLKRHPSRRSLRSLEKEYEMTRSLGAVEGVRKAMGRQSIEGQPALILNCLLSFAMLHWCWTGRLWPCSSSALRPMRRTRRRVCKGSSIIFSSGEFGICWEMWYEL